MDFWLSAQKWQETKLSFCIIMHKKGVTSHLRTNYIIFRPEGYFFITIGTIHIQAKFHTWEVTLAYPLILYQCGRTLPARRGELNWSPEKSTPWKIIRHKSGDRHCRHAPCSSQLEPLFSVYGLAKLNERLSDLRFALAWIFVGSLNCDIRGRTLSRLERDTSCDERVHEITEITIFWG